MKRKKIINKKSAKESTPLTLQSWIKLIENITRIEGKNKNNFDGHALTEKKKMIPTHGNNKYYYFTQWFDIRYQHFFIIYIFSMKLSTQKKIFPRLLLSFSFFFTYTFSNVYILHHKSDHNTRISITFSLFV